MIFFFWEYLLDTGYRCTYCFKLKGALYIFGNQYADIDHGWAHRDLTFSSFHPNFESYCSMLGSHGHSYQKYVNGDRRALHTEPTRELVILNIKHQTLNN